VQADELGRRARPTDQGPVRAAVTGNETSRRACERDRERDEGRLGKPGGLRGTLNFQRSTGDITLVSISPEPIRPNPSPEPLVAIRFMVGAGAFAHTRHDQQSLAFGARISSHEKTVGTSIHLHVRVRAHVKADDGLVLERRGEHGGSRGARPEGVARRFHGYAR
jgi:hypothetical protein